MMQRNASAVWTGDLKSGNGTLTTPSTVLSSTPYSFKTRFEDSPGTNPEELIAAAHAGCFSMALSARLTEAGHKPSRIQTKATVSLEKKDDGFQITKVHLEMKAAVPGLGEEDFQKAAKAAKEGCPVSRVLKAEITMDATLEV